MSKMRVIITAATAALLAAGLAYRTRTHPPTVAANGGFLPFDVVPLNPNEFLPAGATVNPRWDYFNNIPKNPLWGTQANRGVDFQPNPSADCPDGTQDDSNASQWFLGARPCTSTAVTFDSSVLCGPHVEFKPVTYEGTVEWSGHSGTYPFDDDDYEINIFRRDMALYTGGRRAPAPGVSAPIEIEFDADETIDHYDGIPWWQRFRDHVDNPDRGHVGEEISDREAIIIAPADLDGSHGYTPELHPAWLFMVHYSPTEGDDRWAFFVRNWGDKGYCADDDHHLPTQDIRALIRKPEAVDGFAIADTQAIGNDPSVETISQQFVRGQGLLITFHLPLPDAHGWIAGDLHVGWQIPSPVPPPAPAPHPAPEPSPFNFPKAENAVDALVLRMSSYQRERYLKDMQACRRHIEDSRGRITLMPKGAKQVQYPPPGLPKPLQSLVVHDLGRPSQCRKRALCDAFRGQIPGYPQVCGAPNGSKQP